ncbi:MAG: sugar phosphate isomerase/epimerase [Actinobacteria bacterium]|nr:sugar phosphate isomerase/epimerase [Actinomycetota bacterium]
MKLQNFEIKNNKIKEKFIELKSSNPQLFKNRLKMSWSNWGFGLENLEDSVKRLSKSGIKFIELHGNLYGKDLGYKAKEVNNLLSSYGLKVSGICGMYSQDNDFSSNKPLIRQNAIDYTYRNVEFGADVEAKYFLIVPAAVGRPAKYDDMEFERSAETLKIVENIFVKTKIRGAIEPIRSAETSIVHTFEDAKRYITAVASKGIQHINGDVYHMLVEENHIGEAIVNAKGMLTNLHMADSNRSALREGFMDLDTIIMALYIIGYNNDDSCFLSPEPLGPGGDPYPAMYGKPDSKKLDKLVKNTFDYFRQREEEVLSFSSKVT